MSECSELCVCWGGGGGGGGGEWRLGVRPKLLSEGAPSVWPVDVRML